MKKIISTVLFLALAFVPRLRAETTVASAADRDWDAFVAATRVELETPFADTPILERMQFGERKAQQLRLLALAFIENHPTDPRRWLIVSKLNPNFPGFVKEWGPIEATGFPKVVFDEVAAAAWKAKVAELKAAMEKATDVPPEVFAQAAQRKKAIEERPNFIKAFFAKWRSGQEVAPDFPMQDLAGREVRLADFRGKVVVLDFWATWCMSCIDAMPHLQEVAVKYKDQGVVVLSSCTGDSRQKFEMWVRKHQAEFPDLIWTHDPIGKSDQRVSLTLYGVPAIPTQFIIGRDGKVAEVVYGYVKGEVLLDAALAKAGIRVDAATLAQVEANKKSRVALGLEF